MTNQIYMQDGDGIEIDENVGHLYHKCCKCKCEHLVTVDWASVDGKHSVTLRWFPYPPEDSEK